MALEIMPNLWQVGGPGLTGPEDAAAYLVSFGDRAALIDAGCGAGHAALQANIEGCLGSPGELQWLLLTHCHFDHTGGAGAVREMFGCKIAVHALDAVFLEKGDAEVTAASWYGTTLAPLTIDRQLTGETDTIKVGAGAVKAIHCPGHSPGSVIYTATLDNRLVLFGQDVHGPIHPDLLSDEALYQKSLQKMLALNADLLLEGHYGIIEGREKVIAFIQSFMG